MRQASAAPTLLDKRHRPGDQENSADRNGDKNCVLAEWSHELRLMIRSEAIEIRAQILLGNHQRHVQG